MPSIYFCKTQFNGYPDATYICCPTIEQLTGQLVEYAKLHPYQNGLGLCNPLVLQMPSLKALPMIRQRLCELPQN